MVPNLSVITKLVNTKRQKNHLTDFSWATKKALYSVPDSARANSNTILYVIFNLQRTEKCKSGTYCKQYDNLCMIMCQCIAAFVILRTSLIRFFFFNTLSMCHIYDSRPSTEKKYCTVEELLLEVCFSAQHCHWNHSPSGSGLRGSTETRTAILGSIFVDRQWVTKDEN